MPRVVYITTVPQTLKFFRGQVSYLRDRGMDVHVISSPGTDLHQFGEQEGVQVHPVPMTRRISPMADLASLMGLLTVLRSIRPSIVHAHTPKAGLLAMVASALLGVPVRLYTIHGFPFMTRKGFVRTALWFAELAACRLATHVFAVSPSIASYAVAKSLVAPERIQVLGHGSVNGVDAEKRFNPATYEGKRDAFRQELGIPENVRIIGFVGRIVKDKGVIELADAWRKLRNEYADLRLLLVGEFEPEDPTPSEVRDQLLSDPRVHAVGWVDDPAWVYSILDVLVLPSHREGFGVVAIEASAMEVPVVATRIPGCIDAVMDGVTGTLIPVGDSEALVQAIGMYLENPALRRKHGMAGRQRVREHFRPETIWRELYREYERLLSQA